MMQVSREATLSQLLPNIIAASLRYTTTSLFVFPTCSPRGPSYGPVCDLVPAWLYTSSGSEQPPGIPTHRRQYLPPPTLLPWGFSIWPLPKGETARKRVKGQHHEFTHFTHVSVTLAPNIIGVDMAQLSAFHGLDRQSAFQNFISGNLSM